MGTNIRNSPGCPCCDPPPSAYFWFITSTSNYTTQFDFEPCDIFCDSPASVEDDGAHQLRGNILAGGMHFRFRQYVPDYTSTVLCVGVRQWGWKMEMFDDGPAPAQGPLFTWRMQPYTLDVSAGPALHELNPYGIGPFVGQGTIEDLKLRPVGDDEGGPVLDQWGRPLYEGGIWLTNEGYGTECARHVRPGLLLVDVRDGEHDKYLAAAGIEPLRG